jgi:Arc/MetJ family transcription regulator
LIEFHYHRSFIKPSAAHTKVDTISCVDYCVEMATNLDIDERLLEEALRIGGNRTKKATVEEALQEYIQRRKQQKILKLFGKIEYDPSFNYKEQRRRD